MTRKIEAISASIALHAVAVALFVISDTAGVVAFLAVTAFTFIKAGRAAA